MNTARFLLLGKRPDVMYELLEIGRRHGLNLRGSTDLANAARQFDARELDFIGFGGGVEEAEREQLEAAFRAQNPVIRFVGLVAPVALGQLESAAADRLGTVIDALTVEPGEDEDELLVRCRLQQPGFASLTLYHYDGGPQRVMLMADSQPAGDESWVLHRSAMGYGPNFLVLHSAGDIAVARLLN